MKRFKRGFKMLYLTQLTRSEIPMVKKLYEQSFPDNERKPFRMLLMHWKKGKSDLLVIREENNDSLIGFAFFMKNKEDILFDYLAMSPECRNKGYGSEAIKLIKERYCGKRIFGEVEFPDEKFDNNPERIRRMNFYLRNGMHRSGIVVNLFGAEYEIGYFGKKPISYDEYRLFLKKTYGPILDLKIRKNISLKYELNK